MRSVGTTIKSEMIRNHRSELDSSLTNDQLLPSSTDRNQRSELKRGEGPERDDRTGTKKPRPRSWTFTASKEDSSFSKKSKPIQSTSHLRTKSSDIERSASSKSLVAADATLVASSGFRPAKPAVPEDFISYLHKVTRPDSIEIGKLHKLRQLLRNETVSWVDLFIEKGGMKALVELLYRTIAVEWRYVFETPAVS